MGSSRSQFVKRTNGNIKSNILIWLRRGQWRFQPDAKAAVVVTSVRFDTHVRAALDKAAKEDKRPTSSLIQKVMEDWLKAEGYLK